jgi:hypothetical protein
LTFALPLAACGGGDDQATAEASSSAPSAAAGTLDPSMCQDPAFLKENTEFCLSSGAVAADPAQGFDMEGSVTTDDGSFIQYPDGLRGEITGVTVQPNDAQHPSDEHPDFDRLVTVTVKLSNTGEATIPLQLDPSPGTLLYGENRYEAQGWFTDNGSDDLPQQLVPGTDASFNTDYTLPANGLSKLALQFTPSSSKYTQYTFTEVETLSR